MLAAAAAVIDSLQNPRNGAIYGSFRAEPSTAAQGRVAASKSTSSCSTR
jgi:hypothetical protein